MKNHDDRSNRQERLPMRRGMWINADEGRHAATGVEPDDICHVSLISFAVDVSHPLIAHRSRFPLK